MKKIIVYSQPLCPYSNKLKKLLDAHHVPYTDVNLQKNKEALEQIITRDGHTPTPQVEIDGKIFFDYTTEEELVHELMHLAGVEHRH